ncbi:MAG: malto-oligosyltrehalose synthase [Chthoniobacteraceae bacterium]
MTITPSIPTATYRLQFHKGFSFADATALVPYLDSLGISHVYASPIFKAAPGSLHGYDICDHNQLNPELGTREDFDRLASALKERGMGMIVDFVPNHMGIAEPHNAWWLDVLEHGPSSPYASYFDIDWRPLKKELRNKVLLPILGDQYGRVLEQGQLRLVFSEGIFTVHYYETVLPIEPGSTNTILQRALEHVRDAVPEEAVQELESIITAIPHLPSRIESEPDRVAERAREQMIVKRRLKSLCDETPGVEEAIQYVVARTNAPGDRNAQDMLDELLNNQNYRLSYWRVAGEEINYRRFFDINSLAAIRMEEPAVFDATHQLIFELIKEGSVTGLRIDHVDGLYDPKQYLEMLQEKHAEVTGLPPGSRGLYVVVEKILAINERLRKDWPVQGTTGYEFTNQVVSLLTDQSAEKSFTAIYERFTGLHARFHDIVYSGKVLVMRSSMSSEVNTLGSMLNRLSETNRWYRDFTLNSLTAALRVTIASFPVYRTYITPQGEADQDDQRIIERALSQARRRNPAIESSVFNFLRQVLLPSPDNQHPVDEQERLLFVMKLQQCSGPITAKGVEDTAFYVYNRLVALNEVGGEPAIFGGKIETFHQQNLNRLQDFPHSMLTTSTHDTKRAEDVRARLAALSELPIEWGQAVKRWETANRKFKRAVEGDMAPDPNEEYLLYQVLLGSWPLEPFNETNLETYVARIQQYMEKALHEAKVNSSWIEPNEAWDNAVKDFVASVLKRRRFLRSFEPLAERLAELGAINSLSQTVLRLTVPGVPDTYQGTELWDLSLVDPDNRRPVDYELRRKLLDELKADEPTPEDLLEHWRDGRIKLFVIHRLLQLRRKHPELFQQGSYSPVNATGKHQASCVAFCRNQESIRLAVIVPCLTERVGTPPIGDLWEDTTLELGGRWENVLTGEAISGETLEMKDVLRRFPVAVLWGVEGS